MFQITPNNGAMNFTCFRDTDCHGDAVQACAISKISDPVELLEFINCTLVEGFNKTTIPIEMVLTFI